MRIEAGLHRSESSDGRELFTRVTRFEPVIEEELTPRGGVRMTARWPFRAALGFVVGWQIVGPLLAGEHLRWGW